MIEEDNERESLFNITAFAQKFFMDFLQNSPKGKAVGMTYLKEREFRNATIETFEIGYSPEDWDAFYNHAVNNGYKTELMVKAGLIIEKEAKRYDVSLEKLIFESNNYYKHTEETFRMLYEMMDYMAIWENKYPPILTDEAHLMKFFNYSADLLYTIEGYIIHLQTLNTQINDLISLIEREYNLGDSN